MTNENKPRAESWCTFYDPCESFQPGRIPAWRTQRGNPLRSLSTVGGSEELLVIGSQAMAMLGGGRPFSRGRWDDLVDSTREDVEMIRDAMPLEDMRFKTPLGVPLEDPPVREQIDAFDLLSMAHHLANVDGRPHPDEVEMLRSAWCMVCLQEIDSALMHCLFRESGGGIAEAVRAVECLSNAKAIERPELPFKHMALMGAKARVAADPKQADKSNVRECWLLWQKDPARYDGKAAFARDMLQKFENLTNQAVIERWCRTWERTEPAQ